MTIIIWHCFLTVIILMRVSDLCYAKKNSETDDVFQRCMKKEVWTGDNLDYQWFKLSGEKLTFKVKAANDAYIALSSRKSDTHPIIIVIIGGWKNTRSLMMKNDISNLQVDVKTPDILNKDEFRSFWITWKGGRIEAGKQGEEDPFLYWKDPNPFDITYFGIHTGFGATGEWFLYHEDTTLERTSECRIYCQLKYDVVTEDGSFDFDKLNNRYFRKAKEMGLASITCGIEQCKNKKSKYSDKCGSIAEKWRCVHSMIHAPGYIYFNSPAEDWNKRCYGSCILESDGLLTEDGDFDFDAAKKHYRRMEQENNGNSVRIAQSAMQAIDNCGRNMSRYTHKCEAADWMYLCILGNV